MSLLSALRTHLSPRSVR
nr:ORF IIB satellite RNA5 [Cucumber mosaic virus]